MHGAPFHRGAAETLPESQQGKSRGQLGLEARVVWTLKSLPRAPVEGRENRILGIDAGRTADTETRGQGKEGAETGTAVDSGFAKQMVK